MTRYNKMLNNNSNSPRQPLSESLNYRDLEGIMKPTMHVDEFASKMGDDADIIVLSFFVRDKEAAKDLVAWFEKGYDFVLDADRSPGEIKPNRYLVYVEIRRRSSAPDNIELLLDDLSTLTEFDSSEWEVHYDGKTWPWSTDRFRSIVPLTPVAYAKNKEEDLNEWRDRAGIPVKKIHQTLRDIRELKDAAGIV